jgi:hypothetical protein
MHRSLASDAGNIKISDMDEAARAAIACGNRENAEQAQYTRLTYDPGTSDWVSMCSPVIELWRQSDLVSLL